MGSRFPTIAGELWNGFPIWGWVGGGGAVRCGFGGGSEERSQFLGFGFSFLGLREALEALELGGGFLVGLFGGGDAALEAHEDGAGVGESFAELDAGAAFGLHGVIFPEVSFDAEEAAEEPLAADELIDLEAGFGSAWGEVGVVLGLEEGEVFAGFAEDELGIGVEAGFEGILGGGALAFGGARSGGVEGVEAIGLDLFLSWHGS